MKSMRRIIAIGRKEARHILRDYRSLGILILLPVLLLFLFGYAIDLDVTNVRIAIRDVDRSRESREAVTVLENTGYFSVVRRPDTYHAAEYLLDTEVIDAAIWIPEGYARRIARGESTTLEVLIDGANPQTGAGVAGLVDATVTALNQRARTSRDSPGALRESNVVSDPLSLRVWYNPRLESAQMLVPGLAAMILVITAVIATAVGLVREKERGSIEQLQVSPLRAHELILGKTAPYAVISAGLAVLILVLGTVLFGVEIKGDLGALAAVTAVFLIACLGLGLLVSSVARTQQVAFLIAVLVTFLPSFLLSGFVFPIRNMPVPIQNVSRIVPARYYLSAIRSVILKGTGFPLITTELLMLGIFAVGTMGVATWRLYRSGVRL